MDEKIFLVVWQHNVCKGVQEFNTIEKAEEALFKIEQKQEDSIDAQIMFAESLEDLRKDPSCRVGGLLGDLYQEYDADFFDEDED